ncbi:WD repeat-containing protein 6, partial [Xylographa carneopallida]|nr:WD repeat-containing protein 6 [Xylographa carneopallida]
YPAHLPLNTLSLSSDGRFLAASDSRGGLLLLCLHRTQPSAAPATACWWHSQAVYTTAISFMRFFILSSSTCLMTGDALGEVRWWRVDTTEQSAVRLTEACSFRLPLRTHVTSAVLMQVDATEQNSMRTVAEKEDEGDEEMNAQREECTTAEQLLVCGDSKGSVYVYQLLLSANSLSVYASSRLSAVHNSVSALQAHSSTRLVSVGKDATLLSYSLSSTTDPPSAADAAWIAKHNAALPASSRLPLDARFVLVGTSTTRVGIAQLYGILPPPTAVSSSRPLVYGFSSTELKVHDSERQLQLMSVPCGGSRRPHVCFLSPSSAFAAPALHVVYAAHSAAGCTLSHHALPLQSAVAQADSVGDACHSRLTTAVGLVTLRAASYSTRLLLTTGEDGLFKVWRLSHSDRPHAQLLHTVNDHPDTVRALAVLDGADGSVYAFTGGGRDCLYAYQLRRREAEARETSRAGGEVDVIRSGQTGGANVRMKGKSWLRREQPQHSGEQLDAMDVRILSVVAVANSRSTPTHFSCTVLAGDSVGRLRFFHYAASAFELVASSNSHGRPILCLAACHAVVASGDTVGRMRLWDASTPAAPRELGALQLHQAGVNCCALVAVPSSASYRLTTGGDDGCIAVVSFTVSPAFAVVSRAVHPFMHGSAIRCMRVRAEDGLLLTSGYDQRLRLWRVGEADASVTCVAHTALELADVSGLAVLEEVVAVVGAGLSTLRLSEGAVS